MARHLKVHMRGDLRQGHADTKVLAGIRYALPLTPISRWLGSHVRLAWASPRPLARHDRAAQEELAAPDSPELPPLQRSGEAGGPRRALPAESLGRLHVIRRLGEEQLRVICAGQVRTEARHEQQRPQHASRCAGSGLSARDWRARRMFSLARTTSGSRGSGGSTSCLGRSRRTRGRLIRICFTAVISSASHPSLWAREALPLGNRPSRAVTGRPGRPWDCSATDETSRRPRWASLEGALPGGIFCGGATTKVPPPRRPARC